MNTEDIQMLRSLVIGKNPSVVNLANEPWNDAALVTPRQSESNGMMQRLGKCAENVAVPLSCARQKIQSEDGQ